MTEKGFASVGVNAIASAAGVDKQLIYYYFGGLDGLINNGAVTNSGGKYFNEISIDTWDRVMQVNVRGTWLVTRAAHPHLKASGRGRVVNLASDTALWGAPRLLAYVSSKGAVVAMTHALAREFGADGITVNAIAPSARTRMTETVFADMMSTQDKDFDAMAPENISPLVVWLGSVESRDVTGRVFEVEGGIIRAAEGWQHGAEVDKGARWEPAELGPVVRSLLAEGRPPVPVFGA